MMLLCLAALLPSLFWDKGPETVDQLKHAGIEEIFVPQTLEAEWRNRPGISFRVADLQKAMKLTSPGVQFRADRASATRSPWLDSNGWRFLRQPGGRFYYHVPGPVAALAAAEAFLFGAGAMVQTDSAGLDPLGRMLAFLGKLKQPDMPVVANIGFIDDGSPQAGEVMNLLVRRNLLFRIVKSPDSRLDLNVPFGSPKYPKAEAAKPSELTRKIRYELTDEKRALRIYGSEMVIGRLTGDGRRLQVQLLNYAAATRPLNGIRVRVLGRWSRHGLKAFGLPDADLVDYEVLADATEFTLPELKSYAVIDLEP